jgi:hypothetical protein
VDRVGDKRHGGQAAVTSAALLNLTKSSFFTGLFSGQKVVSQTM